MNRSLFITGTDTGIGKTFVTAALFAGLQARKADVIPVKPVQTGSKDGRSQDLRLMMRAAGLSPSTADGLCPFAFPLPASPHLAAARAGTRLTGSEMAEAVRSAGKRHDAMLVEGAGGVLVPLNDEETMLDLMVSLALPVVIAARPGLGTLNHTLLTADAVTGRGLSLAAVVLTPWPEQPDDIDADNLATLQKRLPGVRILTLPFLRINDPADVAAKGRVLCENLF